MDDSRRTADDGALQGTVRRFEAVLSNLHGGILLVSNAGKLEFANQEFCDIFGFDERPQDLPGMPASEILKRIADVHVDPTASLARIASLVAEGRAVYEEDIVLRGPRHYLRDFVPIVVDGQAQGRMWFHRDVTERERSRKLLRDSESRYRTLIDWSPEPIIVHRGGKFIYVNPAACGLFGAASARDLLGQSLLDLVHPEFRQSTLQRLKDLAQHGKVPPIESRNLKLDGTVIDLEVQSIAIDYDGEPAILDLVRDIGARKAAERLLSQSEELLQGVVESAMDAILTIDDTLRVVLFNAAAAAMFGVPRDDAIGTGIDRFIPERFRDAHGGHVRSFGREGRTARTMNRLGQIRALRANGEEFPVEASISHVEIDGRKLYTVIMHDLSPKLLAERDVRLLGAVVAASPQAILIADAQAPDLPIVFVNQAFETSTGYAQAEVMGRNCRFLQGADSEQPERALLRAALGEGRPCEVLLRNYRKDGSLFWNQLTIAPLRDSDGALTHFIAVQNDVTDRQVAMQELAESEARFRMLAEDAPVMIWMTGPDHRYMFVNRAMLAFTGRTAQAQAEKRWDADAHPDELARGREAIDGAAEAHVPFTFEYRRRRHDGEYRWIHAKGMPRFDPQGGFAGYIGTLSDITESKRAEQVLRESAAQLEQRVAARTAELETANKELEAFSYSVSHDLRAPVRHMEGFAILAKEGLPEAEQTLRRYLDSIIRASGRMSALIDDLLALSRTSRAALSIQRVALDTLVRDVAEECIRDAGNRRIVLKIDHLPAVRGDPSLLRQVFVNLIGNAVKFSARREDALIEVLAMPPASGMVTVCVRDNGAGFDMQYADRLFGVFERMHPKDEFEGTGIGLAIVKRVAERHGGRIRVEAKPNLGAAFYFSLPQYEEGKTPAA